MKKNYAFDTLQLHAGWRADPATGAHALPLYQTNAFMFENADDAAMQFTGERPGSIYTRLANPNVSILEERLCALEGGYRSVAFASGMSALLALTLTLAEPGDEVVALSALYGGSYALLFNELEPRYGIKARCVEPDDLDGLESAVNERTRMIYLESVANPLASVADIDGIVSIARKYNVPVALDNTFCTPYLFDAAAHGIDFTLHSLTKYLCGFGSSLGGSVTDMGSYCFLDNPRFPQFNRPDAAHHGCVYAQRGQNAFTDRMRDFFLHDAGLSLSPFNAYMITMGMQTLSLRMDKHVKNADAVAKFLASHPAVKQVNYARLPDSPYYERAKKLFPKGAGGVFTFVIQGGFEAGKRFIDSLELFALVSNVGDSRSLVVHPASTTHSPLTPKQLAECGISPDMIRLSIGLEDASDLIADLDQALNAAVKE